MIESQCALFADISPELALRAFEGTSHAPERCAASARFDYVSMLLADLERLARVASQEDLDLYRDGFRKRYTAWLEAKSRCVSVLIAGPAKFPVARQAKRTATADRRRMEIEEYRRRSVAAIERKARKATTLEVDAPTEPDLVTVGSMARVVESAADKRIRLVFEGKPDDAVRTRLKHGGFRWAPSVGAWQAFINNRSRYLAKEIAGVTAQTNSTGGV